MHQLLCFTSTGNDTSTARMAIAVWLPNQDRQNETESSKHPRRIHVRNQITKLGVVLNRAGQRAAGKARL